MNLLSLFSKARIYLPALVSFLYVGSCFAQAVTLGVVPGRKYTKTNFDTSSVLEFAVERDRSYCCEAFPLDNSGRTTSIGTFSVTGGTIADESSRSRNAPWLGAGRNSVDARKCFRFEAASSSTSDGAALLSFSIGSNVNPIPELEFSCEETSLFGGFNTSVTDFNFIEVSNTLGRNGSSSSVTVVVSAQGVIAGAEVINQTFTLAPGERRDIDVHSSAANDFGPVLLSHNGPKGSIKAVNVQYRIVSQDPLDFEPVLSVPFTSRQ